MRGSTARRVVSLRHAAGYFLVVPVVSPAMLWTFFLLLAAGSAAIVVDVRAAREAMTPLLLLQLFAAASGFRVPARRGHYDLLLTSGVSRVGVAVAHWVMSVYPGVLAWLALALTERVAGAGTLTTTGTILAVAFMSTAPWALAMPLPRMSAAIFWLVVFFTTGTALPGTAAVAANGLFPWVFVGVPMAGVGPVGAGALLLVASGSVMAAVFMIHRMDVPLESAQ
jgi:hypothetical protein